MELTVAVVLAVTAAVFSYFLSINSTWWPLNSSAGFADLVVGNATIYTADPSLPFADAMAIRNGRILRVGTHSSVQELIGHKTQFLNLDKNFVTPGFIDSHLHFISGGLQMAQVELHGASDQGEFIRRVAEALEGKDMCSGTWVLGGGWNNDIWGGDLPTSSWIDEITPNNPVWLYRMDGHMGLANSVALKMVGVTKDTLDPVGGAIIRTDDGEPTGLLVDSAMQLILPLIPEVSIDERRDALARASRHALSRGVTTVVDFGRYLPGASVDKVWDDFSDVYQWADNNGKMQIRACLFFPMQTWSQLATLVQKKGKALSEHVYLGGVKAFADGSLGSNSALFYEHYVEEPDNYGLQVTDPDWLLNSTLAADKAGLQVAIHAIGDKANDLILELYSKVENLNGGGDRRFRVEHAQHLAIGAPARFGKQGIIASVQDLEMKRTIGVGDKGCGGLYHFQPQHLLDDADSAERKLGVDRAHKGSYLFKSLTRDKAELVFGSDWPVADINPLAAIRTARMRIPHGRETAWTATESISLDDALTASTISAAHGCFIDEDLGSLSAGKLADFVVLSVNNWEEFMTGPSPSVLATYVGGSKAYP